MKTKQRTSPLKVDPTRSITARLFFSRGLTKLFSNLRGAIVNIIVKEDILGLKSDLPNIEEYEPTYNKKWKYLSQADAVEEFDKWVKDKIKQTILSPTQANKWTNFIQKGFNKGAARAFDDTSKARKEVAKDNLRGVGFTEGRREQFIRQTLSKPTAINKLKLLQQRALSDVKGMADDLLTKAKRTLTDGLVKGLNPTDIALSLSKVLRISEARARSIAFTELVRAHADGQLEAMEQLGVKEVGVAVEWSTTATPCKLCQPLEGIILTIEEAKGMIPRHVRCMCAWLPANVGEDKEEKKQQIRGKYRIDQAIAKSRRLSDQKGWKPYVPIARNRPKPTVNVLLDCDCSGMERFAKLLSMVDNSEKLTGGEWRTIHGQHVYIKGGEIVAGGSNLPHDKELTRLHETYPILKSIEQHTIKVHEGEHISTPEGVGLADTKSKLYGAYSHGKNHIDIAKEGADFEGRFRHEYGHHVQDHLKLYDTETGRRISWQNIYEKYKNSELFTDYHKLTHKEMFADSFARYTSKEYKKGQLPKEIENFFHKLLNQASTNDRK